MSAINFVMRTRMGAVEHGSVGGEDQGFLIDAGAGNDISLNLNQAEVRGYDRAADDLLITLADGRVIVLEGYFSDAGNRFFVSSGGTLNQVSFVETEGSALYAQYGPTETWGKWSPSDELIFVEEPTVMAGYYDGEEEVSMLGAGLLGLGGLGGMGAAGAAAVGGLALASGLGGGGGGGGSSDDGGGDDPWVAPTVDNADGSVSVGGPDAREVTITGTANPGSEVEISIGDKTATGTTGDDGTWEVVFDGDDFPDDGDYGDLTVVVTDPDGTVTDLDGPSVVIDTTPPDLTIDTGTVSNGHLFNAEGYTGGVAIGGTAEAGSTVTVTIGEHSQTVTVGGDGSWSFSFDSTVLPAGEYVQDLTITATDSFMNVTTSTAQIQIDTVNEISLDNGPLTGDDLINAAEFSTGVTLTGQTQVGSSVEVTIEGVTRTATVDASGGWSVTFSSTDLTAGTYLTTASIVSVDLSGNSVTTSHSFTIDTELSLTIDTHVETDGIVNAAERADGVVLNGTGEAGASVSISVAGSVIDTTVNADGTWSVTIPASDIPEGETSLAVTATSTDTAGNTTSASGSIAIDTTTSVAVSTSGVAGDGTVNEVEHGAGVTLTGMAEAGSTVAVTLGSVTHQATVTASGAWSVSFTSSEIPTGEQVLDVTAVSTDAAGNSATATGTLHVDTLVTNFTNTSTPGGTDGILNAAEASQGLTLTGTTEIGSAVTVSFGGFSRQATVDASGNWSVTYAAAELPTGEQTVTMSATAIDLAGNAETLSQDVRIDTHAGQLTISPAPVEGDDVVNFAEASDGVVLTGTSDPFQMVDVTMNGVSMTVQTDATGIWRAPFAAFQVAAGTYDADITATITDSAGNTLTRTDSVHVDTEVLNFASTVDTVTADNVINAVERAAGVSLTGTTEPGGSVTVVIEGQSYTANVDGSGNWSISLGAAQLPEGETTVTAQILTTDAVGNTDQTSLDLTIDTEVRVLNTSDAVVAGDDVINAAEAMAGFSLTGEVEPGSTVVLNVGGQSIAATVTGDGQWSADIPPSAIAGGTGSLTVEIVATDAAGNVDSTSKTLGLDTEAPDTLAWTGYGRDGTGIDQIRTEITEDTLYLGQLAGTDAAPLVLDVALADVTEIPVLGETYITPSNTIPDGTQLVLTSTDAAGNTSGALLVTDDPATNTVAMSDQIADALGSFQIDTIDLHFAEDSNLTITEAQITALSSTTDTVAVEGGSDDSVTITGATAQGGNGSGYNVFTLGDATILIDDDITNVNTGVV